MKLWKCKACATEWLTGDGIKGAPRRCYNETSDFAMCNGTEFELLIENVDKAVWMETGKKVSSSKSSDCDICNKALWACQGHDKHEF